MSDLPLPDPAGQADAVRPRDLRGVPRAPVHQDPEGRLLEVPREARHPEVPDLPGRDTLITITFGVVFLSLVIQGSTSNLAVRVLGLEEREGGVPLD